MDIMFDNEDKEQKPIEDIEVKAEEVFPDIPVSYSNLPTVLNFASLPLKETVNAITNSILEGETNPLDAHIALKKMEKIIEEVKKEGEVADVILTEAKKYTEKQQTFEYGNAKITVGAVRTYYDFKECNDPYYNELIRIEKEVKELKKLREAELKLLIPKTVKLSLPVESKIIEKMPHFELLDYGEEHQIRPPVKKQKTGLKTSFKL